LVILWINFHSWLIVLLLICNVFFISEVHIIITIKGLLKLDLLFTFLDNHHLWCFVLDFMELDILKGTTIWDRSFMICIMSSNRLIGVGLKSLVGDWWFTRELGTILLLSIIMVLSEFRISLHVNISLAFGPGVHL
jgi:hypothetical protein